MPSTANDQFEQESIDALSDALALLQVGCTRVAGDSRFGADDAIVEIGGQRFAVEAKHVVTAADGFRFQHRLRPFGLPLIVVAERIAQDARQAIRSAPKLNYYDRRGYLHIVSPPIIIDTAIGSDDPAGRRPRGVLDTQVAKEVAIICLATPDRKHRVREVSRQLLRAPSAVSNAMSAMREQGFLTSAGEPAIPDLFHELVAAWRPPNPVSLAACPEPVVSGRATRLRIGIDDIAGETGWALTGVRAAMAWGMPVVAQGDHPPDLYVPDETVLRIAVAQFGRATDPALRSCTVAVTPVRLGCLHRVDRSSFTDEKWPVANHVIVACDIALDKARGLEALNQWRPEGVIRGW